MADIDVSNSSKPLPEFAAIWEKMRGSFPSLAEDIPSVRGKIAAAKEQLAASQPNAAEGVSEEDSFITARDGHKILVRNYRPNPPPEEAGPLVIIYHGGGFALGNVESEATLSRLFAKHLGCSCVNVDYRLAPEHKFPTAPNDCWDATQYIAANAGSFGADPRKGFVLGGNSAGGNLTDVVAHIARDEKLQPPVTGLMEQIPAVLRPNMLPEKYKHLHTSRDENKDAPILPLKTMTQFEAHYQPDLESPLYNSAVASLHRDGHKGIAKKVWFSCCGMDPLRDDAIIYEKILREEYGIATKIKLYSGVPHGFWSFMPTLSTTHQYLKDAVEGMRWLLA